MEVPLESKIAALIRVGWRQAGDDGDEWWPPAYMFEWLPADTMTLNTENAYKAAKEASIKWVQAGESAANILRNLGA